VKSNAKVGIKRSAKVWPTLRRIKDMKVGERGYTAPWVFKPDNNDPAVGYLETDAPIMPDPGGTAQMEVKCVGAGQYEVEQSYAAMKLMGLVNIARRS